MLPEAISSAGLYLAQASPAGGNVFSPPTDNTIVQMLLMWLHFIAGIIWIGHLYFFNFVNVNLMKVLDGPTKGKVIPQLMPRALWWFRWGALVTVFVGFTYYAMYILAPNVRTLRAEQPGVSVNVWVVLLVWLLVVIATFVALFYATRAINNGITLAVVTGVIVTIMGLINVWWLDSSLYGSAGNRTLNIGIGGALGIIMLLNVWGVIWPAQKRIIAWTYDNAEKGTAIPAESATLARRAFLASRMNTWLSIPMLFFMGASQYYPMFG